MCIYRTDETLFKAASKFAWMLDYLTEIAATGQLPRRQDLDPVRMSHVISAVNLVDLIEENGRFRLRYRLVGSLQAYFFTGEETATGRFLDSYWEGEPELYAKLEEEYRVSAALRTPVLGTFRQPRLHGDDFLFQRALFPMGSDGETVDCFVGLHEYRERQHLQGAAQLAKNPVKRPDLGQQGLIAEISARGADQRPAELC